MSDALLDQAERLEALLPGLLRRLFALDPERDLPIGQLRTCRLLQQGPRTMSQVAEELGTSVSAVTQIADRLERAGLVERTSEGIADRRVRNLRLTGRGAAWMAERRALRVRYAAEALERLAPDERAAALGALERLYEIARPSRSTDTISL